MTGSTPPDPPLTSTPDGAILPPRACPAFAVPTSSALAPARARTAADGASCAVNAGCEGRPFAPMGVGHAVSGAVTLALASALTIAPYRTAPQNQAPPDAIGRAALSEAANTAALLAAPFAGGALTAAPLSAVLPAG